MSYHPDDDGGELASRMMGEESYACCGGREAHRIGCEYDEDDTDTLAVDPDEPFECPACGGPTGEENAYCQTCDDDPDL